MSPSALLELEEKAEALLSDEAVNSIVDSLYQLDVSDLNDDGLVALEGIIEKMLRLLTSDGVHQHAAQIGRLLEARKAIEQGLSPDPNKRPSPEEMRAFVSAHLGR